MMKIDALAKKSGLSTSTIYEYIKTGILHPAIKTGPTRSFYNESHLHRLNTIKTFKKKEKLSLSDIKKKLSSEENNVQIVPDPTDNIKVQIIDTALEMFSKSHYELTKISDITHALNIGSGTFYKYFKSKEELFLDCLGRIPRVLVPKSAWDEVNNETNYIRRLKKRGYAMLNAFPSYIGILNHVKLLLGSDDKTVSKKAAQCLQSLVTPLILDLKAAIKNGHVREIDAELAAYILLGINESFAHRLLIDSKYTVEEGFAVIADFISGALSVSDTPQPEKTTYLLTDINGSTIALTHLLVNNQPVIKGQYYQGTLELAIADMDTVSIDRQNPTSLVIMITLTNKTTASVIIDPNLLFSGRTQFGKFSIKAEKIKKIINLGVDNKTEIL